MATKYNEHSEECGREKNAGDAGRSAPIQIAAHEILGTRAAINSEAEQAAVRSTRTGHEQRDAAASEPGKRRWCGVTAPVASTASSNVQSAAGGAALPGHPPFLPLRFETAAQALWRLQQLIGCLRRSRDPQAQQLSNTLAACTPTTRCGSGACPVCQRRIRYYLLRDAHRLLMGRGPLLRLSWIPAGGLVPVGGLAAFDLARFLKSRQRALQRALPEVTLVFGGADVSLNTFDNGSPVWQVHVYVILVARDAPELRRRVRQHCPGEPQSPRPFQFDRVTEPAEAMSYAVKAIVTRRSSYIDGDGRLNSRSQLLRADAAVEAALYQARWPMTRRLLLRGLRVVYRSEGPRLTSNLRSASRRGQ